MEQHDPTTPHAQVWPPPPTNTPTPTYTPPDYVSARRLSQVFLVLTCITVVGYAFSTLISGRGLKSPSSTSEIISNVSSLVSTATSLCFLVWTHRAYKNLRALGAQGLRYTPAWAVGYFFVPILSLYRPYQVFRELWQASDPSPDVRAGQAWPLTTPPPLLPTWWLCNMVVWVIIPLVYVVPIMIYVFQHFQTLTQTGAVPQFSTPSLASTLVALAMDTLSAFLGVLVIRAITDRQETAAHVGSVSLS